MLNIALIITFLFVLGIFVTLIVLARISCADNIEACKKELKFVKEQFQVAKNEFRKGKETYKKARRWYRSEKADLLLEMLFGFF